MIGEMKSKHSMALNPVSLCRRDWQQAAEAFGMTPAVVGLIVVALAHGCSAGVALGASCDAAHAVRLEVK
jgi:hypothetical protein